MEVLSRLAPAPSYTGTFSGSDGLHLFEQGWHPPGAPRGVLVIVHGYAEHSGRYARHVLSFLERGLAVHTYDLRGFGQSGGDRAFVPSFDAYLADLDRFLDRVRDREPERPLFVLGHSMGGLIAALYGIVHRPPLAGLILSSPAVQTYTAPLLQRTSGFVGRLFPRLPTLYLDRRGLCRDKAIVHEAEHDPLNYHGRMPARTGAELIRAGRQARTEAHTLTLPLLITHGTADPITDPEGSRTLYNKAGATDKTLSLFEGFYHETFNERHGFFVLDTMTAWIEEHV